MSSRNVVNPLPRVPQPVFPGKRDALATTPRLPDIRQEVADPCSSFDIGAMLAEPDLTEKRQFHQPTLRRCRRHCANEASLRTDGARHPEEAKAPDFRTSLEAVFDSYRTTLSDDMRALLDRYQIVDAAIKVVCISSVGRRCWIALLMSANNDPLFLQFKEAGPSALERFVGKSAYTGSGELMQPVSDIFLGWVTAPNGREFYVRQLRDAKIKPLIECFDAEWMEAYAKICGWVLARAHSKAGDVATIAGYLGATSDIFDKAIASFAKSRT